uniref:Uncharacterized protein n=1 Tax=Cacopsylla melanoneura TaxID=428564 RepID=A0A8D9FC78_9HEMI
MPLVTTLLKTKTQLPPDDSSKNYKRWVRQLCVRDISQNLHGGWGTRAKDRAQTGVRMGYIRLDGWGILGNRRKLKMGDGRRPKLRKRERNKKQGKSVLMFENF